MAAFSVNQNSAIFETFQQLYDSSSTVRAFLASPESKSNGVVAHMAYMLNTYSWNKGDPVFLKLCEGGWGGTLMETHCEVSQLDNILDETTIQGYLDCGMGHEERGHCLREHWKKLYHRAGDVKEYMDMDISKQMQYAALVNQR